MIDIKKSMETVCNGCYENHNDLKHVIVGLPLGSAKIQIHLCKGCQVEMRYAMQYPIESLN